MRRLLAAITTALTTLAVASSALGASTAGSTETSWNTPAAAKAAAEVMQVSQAQAAENLTVQHEAFHTIGKLIEAGDQVWFDNADATIHVYGSTASVAMSTEVARHIVHDAHRRTFPASKVRSTDAAESCGTSRRTEEFCSPMEGGQLITKHIPGYGTTECTVGFMVRDSSGNPYFLTAAHCAAYGTTFYSEPFSTKEWPSGTACELGTWVSGLAPWTGYDAAIAPVAGCGGEGMSPWMHDWENGHETHQEGADFTPYVGEAVCHWGITTLYQCGVEQAVDVSTKISYGNIGHEYTIEETDQVCGGGYKGDSGGPVADETYPGDATGIFIAIAVDNKCAPDKTLWTEERIYVPLNAFHVSIAT